MTERSRLAEGLDGLGLRAVLMLLGVGWFTFLWGLNLPSVLAGIALGTLMHLTFLLYRRSTLARRERSLRVRLGGEMLLEDLLYMEAPEAHEKAAALLMGRWPLTPLKTTPEGTLCRQGTETLLVICLRMTEEAALSAGHLADSQRALRKTGADRAVLCVLGKTPPRVAARADELPQPVRVIRRDTLLTLAGLHAPATDAQLVALGERRRRGRKKGSLLETMLRRDKAGRYWGYGLFMLVLYVLTGSGWYAVPGAVCLTMAVLSRSPKASEEKL